MTDPIAPSDAQDPEIDLATVLPRSAILPQIDKVADLQQAAQGWCMLRPERQARITPPFFVGSQKTRITQLPVFNRSFFRIPPLCLSKYSDVTILPHQFIQTAPSILSGDSCEDPVFETDGVWFHESLAFVHDGVEMVYPRLKDCGWHVERNIVDIKKAAKLPLVELEGPVLDITAWYPANVSHWLVDVLPRLWALPFIRERNLKILVPERVPSGRPPFMMESLELMGFEPDDIIWFKNNRRYQIETLYVPSRVAGHYSFFSPEIISFYDQLPNRIQNFTAGTDPLLYISRQDAPQRRCLNEAEFEAALKNRGFRILNLTEIDFAERVSLMRGAKLLAGPCGAGMAHALMMQDNTDLFITAAPDMHRGSTLFQNIASMKQQSITLLAGKTEGSGPATKADWSLDLENTLQEVDRVLAAL